MAAQSSASRRSALRRPRDCAAVRRLRPRRFFEQQAGERAAEREPTRHARGRRLGRRQLRRKPHQRQFEFRLWRRRPGWQPANIGSQFQERRRVWRRRRRWISGAFERLSRILQLRWRRRIPRRRQAEVKTMKVRNYVSAGLSVWLAAVVAQQTSPTQKGFPTPDAAAHALVEAARDFNVPALLEIL